MSENTRWVLIVKQIYLIGGYTMSELEKKPNMVFEYTMAEFDFDLNRRSDKYAWKCLKCGGFSKVTPCGNCGSSVLTCKHGGWLYCDKCDSYRDYWKCSCGCNNPVGKTFGIWYDKDAAGKCFIATAVYGSNTAPEVLLLRRYRDEVLLKSIFGKLFVKCYYFISPGISKIITKHNRIKQIIKCGFLRYIVALVEKR